MSLEDIQKQVHKWISQYTEGYWKPHVIYTRLGKEVGELAREINHLYGPKKKKSSEKEGDLGEEIGDIIFTLCCLANSQNINLDEAFKKVMDKYYERDNNRFKKRT